MERGKPTKEGTSILCLDPSLTATGIVAIRNGIILEALCVKTEPVSKKMKIRKSDDRVRRIQLINQEILTFIKTHSVKYIVSELPHGSQNAAAATSLGLVVGTIQGIADSLDIPVEWFSEQDSKVALLGKKSATKEETIRKVDKVFSNVPWTKVGFRDEAIADALSVYFVASKQSPTVKFLNQ